METTPKPHILKPEECVVFWGMGSVCSNFHGAEYRRLEMYPRDPNEPQVVLFKSVEHDYMYHKAMYFKDYYHAEKIRTSKEPKDAKRWGRKVRWFKDGPWDLVKEKVMFEAKLAQAHEYLYISSYYVKMNGRTFIEASPYDEVWGVKLRADDPKVYNKRQWQGKNLLGKVCGKLAKVLAAEAALQGNRQWMQMGEVANLLLAFCTRNLIEPSELVLDGLTALVMSNVFDETNHIHVSVKETTYKRIRQMIDAGLLRGFVHENPIDRCLEILDYNIRIRSVPTLEVTPVKGVPGIREKWAAFSWVVSNPVLFGIEGPKLNEIAQYMQQMDRK